MKKKNVMIGVFIFLVIVSGIISVGNAGGKRPGKNKGIESQSIDVAELNNKGVYIEKIDSQHDLMLVAVDPYNENAAESYGARWFILGEGRPDEISLATSMGEVDGMKASENRQYLAIWSHGEGHPCIDVHPMRQLLEGKDTIIYEKCGYLEMVEFDHWEGEKLVIKSDMPLDLGKNIRENDCVMFRDMQTYRVELPGGKVSPVSSGAQDPAAYWISKLNPKTEDGSSRQQAACALGVYQDQRAIPALEAALKNEHDADIIMAIETALKQLRK